MVRRPRAGPFHGLAPYTEEDRSVFYGRNSERAALLELGRQASCSLILVTGEVASGKTSLLRAGLVGGGPPALLPLYLELGPGWQYQLRESLARLLERAISADDDPAQLVAEFSRQRKARPLLILDPVEMLLWMEDSEVELVRKVLAQFRGVPGIGLVLAADRGNLHALSRLGIGAASISPAQTITLGRFDRERAAELMEQTVLGGGGYLEAGLPQQMAHELAANGPVLPAALQVLGHAAMVRNATSHKAYARAGGAVTLTAFYVDMLAARAGAWRAQRVLAVLSEQPSPRIPLSLEDVARGAGLEPPEAERILAALEEEGLVRTYPAPPHVSDGGTTAALASGHTILHPYLRQPIRDLVAPIYRGRAAARLMLRRRIQHEQVLRPVEAFSVRRYLGLSLEERERSFLERSIRVWTAVAALCVAVPMLIISALYLAMASSAHLDSVPGPGGGRYIVLESGTPTLDVVGPLVPGRFHQVEVDTAINLASVPDPLRRAVRNSDVRGRIRGPAQFPEWQQRLLEGLPPVRRAALLVLAGERDAGGKLMLQAAASPESRERAIVWTTLLLDRADEIRRVLMAGIQDPRPSIRLLALERARRLGREALPLIQKGLADRDGQVRESALAALSDLGPAESLPLLRPLLKDQDPRVQQRALTRLDALSRTQPLLVLDTLLELGERRGGPHLELDQAMERLLASDRRKLAAHLSGLLAKAKSSARRALLLQWLGSLAEHLPATQLRPALERVAKDSSPAVQAAALSLQARFEAPDVAKQRLGDLAKAAGNRPQAVAQRRAAATGLGLISGPLDRDRLKLLKALVRDREPAVRAAAVRSLQRVGMLGLVELSRAMKNGPPDVAEAAVQVVCEGGVSSRNATTILGVAWKLKRQTLRQRALRCAQSLADASLRLRLWLADEAAKDKDPKVRRAGAAAAALALREGGPQFLRLARLYLKDPDPELRQAMLQAIVERPPANASFLFDIVERYVRDPEPTVRAAAAGAVQLSAPTPMAAVQALKKLLEDNNGKVRRAAVHAAAKLEGGPGQPLLEGPFANLLGSGAAEDALDAVPVAGRLGLRQALRRGTAHNDRRVRAAALEALLPHLAAAEALPLLEAALRDPQSNVREVALRAAGGLDPRLGEALTKLLDQASSSAEPSARAAAFKALGRVRGKAAAAAFLVLQEAARHPSEERRRLAMTALGDLATRNPRAAELLADGAEDPALDVRREAQRALAVYLGEPADELPALWALLQGSEREGLARRIAVAALAHYGRRHGTFRLRELVGSLRADTPVVTRIAAHLSLALARAAEPPENAIAWLYGW